MNRQLNRTLKYALFFLFVCCAHLQAQYSECELYAAYLKNDMTVWDKYLHNQDFNKLSTTEKLRYLDFEYGYIATALDQKKGDASEHVSSFEAHINALQPVLSDAQYKMYKSSLAAYKAMLNKFHFISKGLESFNLINEAYKLDSMDTSVLMLKASVEFYAPKTFGGDKKQALAYYLRAKSLYEKQGLTQCNWNYMSCLMCIAQCYDKLGNTKRAIRFCHDILAKEPNFTYIKKQLLPELEKKNS